MMFPPKALRRVLPDSSGKIVASCVAQHTLALLLHLISCISPLACPLLLSNYKFLSFWRCGGTEPTLRFATLCGDRRVRGPKFATLCGDRRCASAAFATLCRDRRGRDTKIATLCEDRRCPSAACGAVSLGLSLGLLTSASSGWRRVIAIADQGVVWAALCHWYG